MSKKLYRGPEWKQITRFPNYWISDRGHVFNMALQRLKKPYITNKGQKAIRLSKDGKLYTRSLDKLYREAFGENDEHQTQEAASKPPTQRSDFPQNL